MTTHLPDFSGKCLTLTAISEIYLPRITDPLYTVRFFRVSAEIEDVLEFCGAPLYTAGYGLLQVTFFRELHAALATAGAQPGQVVVYEAPTRDRSSHTLTAAFELSDDGRYRLAAVSVCVDETARGERVYILDQSGAQAGNGQVWTVEQVSAAAPVEVIPVAVFSAPGDLALPSDPAFNPGRPVLKYASFLKTSLELVGMTLQGLSSGLAHPVRTPDLVRRALDMLVATPRLADDYEGQPIPVVYRAAAKTGETRLSIEFAFEETGIFVTALSVEEALVDLAEELELLPPEEDLVLFDDAA
jgi:hypothetical protein